MSVPPASSTTSMQPLAIVRLRQDLARGTIVEVLDENTVLVEFADEHGKTLELVPVPKVLLARISHTLTVRPPVARLFASRVAVTARVQARE
ncbi:DUF4926 domain-containing protein, partial [Thauera sp. AutoDN2]|uniref:DUF4926 domain-containing protein n=1 Tax=Thauera sp. AutoDN2 TaxID=3416051 RepID=UPI003F4C5ECD